MNLCWIIPIITAIIGAILGWLLRHLTCKCDNNDSNELEALKAKNNKLQADLNTCLSKKIEPTKFTANTTPDLELSSSSLAEKTIDVEPNLIFDAAGAKAAFGKKVIADDLKVVEGIGPKISELFNNNGITTWYQLSKASVERCQEVLNTGGKRFEIHKPTTWPKQAGLAFNGKWQELKELQDYLDGGKERT